MVDTRRVKNARYALRVAEFILRDEELADMRQSRDEAQYLASRLAAKEAVIKACPERLFYHDIMLSRDGEKLVVKLCKQLSEEYNIWVSIAHELEFAIGLASAYSH